MSDDADASRTGDESPAQVSSSAKRKRTSRACDQCRGRKHKCDGRQPTCTPCSVSGSPCNYGSGIKRRGLAAGYVRSLELLWALVFAVVPNGEKVVTDLLTDLEFDLDPGGKLIMVGKLVGDSETLRQSWMKSSVQVELERRLSKLEARVDANPRAVNSFGSGLESSNPCLDVSRLVVAHFEPIHQSSPGRAFRGHESSVLSGRGPSPNARYALHNKTSNRGQPSPNNLQPLSFPLYSQRLLETYFSYTNSWLPIIERHKIFQVLYSSPGSHAANRGDESTLWAILAYSSLQEARGRIDAILASGSTDGLDAEGLCLTPRQLYAQARRSIPDEEEIPEPGHDKALLILSLYQLYRGALSAAWRLIGRSVRICLGLQGQPRTPTSDTDENQTCALLGCFVLDTIVSSHLGKPPHLRSADIRHLPSLAETGPNEWEPWTPPRSRDPNLAPGPPEPMRAVSMFNRFVEMIRILNDAMWEPVVGSPPAHAAERHVASLRHWSDHLPQHCALPSLPDLGQPAFPSRFSPQLVNLHLAFKSTLVLMRTQHNSPTTQWIPFDQIFPGPKRPFILRLLAIYGEKFGDPFTPAIFASYKSFSDAENSLAPSSLNSELEMSNPHQGRHLRFAVPIPESGADYSTEDVMSTATPSDSIAVSHSEQTFPFGFSEGSYTVPADMNRGQNQLPPEHVDLGRAEDISQEHPDVVAMGEFPRFDHNFIGSLDSLDGIEWDAQSSEFMLNLGFTGLIPDLSHPMDPP